jgi:hypothetical protein
VRGRSISTRFLGALRSIGWTGVLSIEVLSSNLRTLALDDYVRRVHDATVSLLRR